MTALHEKYNKWDNEDICFDICELDGTWYFRDDHKLVLGINWAAIGTKSAEETVKFANSLIEVSKVIDRINALDLVVDREKKDNLDTKEAFNNAVENFMALYLEG